MSDVIAAGFERLAHALRLERPGHSAKELIQSVAEK